MSARKTVAFRDVRADVLSECRFAYVRGRAPGSDPIDPPTPLTGKWIKEICEQHGVDEFKVITERDLYWQRSYEMGANYGKWTRTQVVGKTLCGSYLVLDTKTVWPGY